MNRTFLRGLVVLGLGLMPVTGEEEGWVELFNGKDLSGWTPKIAKHALGENFAETFRVEDGILKVSYDGYGGKFDGQFGHLFTDLAYSDYILRLDYQLLGEKLADTPGYANLNSGVMYHSQPPQSMAVDQPFPVCLEFQFLADEGKGPRATANICTPGTNVHFNGKLTTDHIIPSSAPTFQPGEWVSIELEVHGDREAVHRVNGVEVLRIQKPELDPSGDLADSKALLAAGATKELGFGHLALQAEGQPVWFRNIRLKPLEPSVSD